MKYFTLSALCVLICCMLFALSGTTDLPTNHRQMVAQTTLTTSPLMIKELQKQKHAPSDNRIQTWLPETEEKHTIMEEAIIRENKHRLFMRLFGILFIAGWIFLSFKLLSTD